jgi:1-acyl-sn-glycerol-3-phosphate acyltransferase
MRRTGWARSAPVRAVREFVQVVGVKNVMRKELTVEVYGLDEFRQLHGPALIVANHASHLDTAVLLSTLPIRRRRHTAVAIEADYFFDNWWRAGGSAIAFNTLRPGCWQEVGL